MPNKDISIYIFNNVIDFIEEVKKSSEMLKNIHIKTVITYIRNVYLFKSSDNNTDIIGCGVDFSFRLEKFAEPTHLVVNEMFYESIKEMATNYTGIKCNKMLQGWKEPQLFYLISDIKFFESALGTIVPNPFSNDVNIELFQWYIIDKKIREENNNNINLGNDKKMNDKIIEYKKN